MLFMLHALTLTILAGLSTGIGGLAAALFRPGRRAMALCSGFAAGVMLAVSLLDLIPHALQGYQRSMGSIGAGLAVTSLMLLGMGTAALLELLLPEPKLKRGDERRASVLRGALVTALALLAHDLPEGALTLFAGVADPAAGLRLSLAVGLHNMPEGMAVAAPLYYATGSRTKAVGAAFASGLAEPLGAVLAFGVLGNFLTPGFLNGLLASVAGVMCWAAAFELLPMGYQLGPANKAAAGFAVGVVTMLLGISVLS